MHHQLQERWWSHSECRNVRDAVMFCETHGEIANKYWRSLNHHHHHPQYALAKRSPLTLNRMKQARMLTPIWRDHCGKYVSIDWLMVLNRLCDVIASSVLCYPTNRQFTKLYHHILLLYIPKTETVKVNWHLNIAWLYSAAWCIWSTLCATAQRLPKPQTFLHSLIESLVFYSTKYYLFDSNERSALS